MPAYVITTPKNPEYEGTVYGVRFHNGEAYVNQHTISKTLGLTLEQVIQKIGHDFGYDIREVLGDEAKAPPTEMDLVNEEIVAKTKGKK